MKFFMSIIAGLLVGLTPALAQDITGCTQSHLTDPDRTVFTCENGLVIEAEAVAEIQTLTPAADDTATPQALQIDSDAILVTLPTGQGPFQILTPHAIATVRGTTYVVDVSADKTAVFVIEGVVAVARDDKGETVDLKAGEGVTVAGQTPLEVKTWPQEKVATLLARFAR